jgi:hypothetical protein
MTFTDWVDLKTSFFEGSLLRVLSGSEVEETVPILMLALADKLPFDDGVPCARAAAGAHVSASNTAADKGFKPHGLFL